MALPKAIRSRTPAGLRDLPWLRAVALGAGLIPPRVMHSPGEAALLGELAREARCVVEIGVYEGSSALVFCDAMAPSAELHLIDPYPKEAGAALFAGWRGSPRAPQLVVRRGHRGTGPHVRWHLERSQDVGRKWRGPSVDLVFIDGDHSAEACREDWDMWQAHVCPGGAVAFHDARLGQPGGDGGPGPTQVVDELFRGSEPPTGYHLAIERERLVVVRRTSQDIRLIKHYYEELWEGLPDELEPPLLGPRLAFLRAEVRAGDRALDLGCGTGEFTEALVVQGAQTVGADVAEAALVRAQARHPELDFRLVPIDGPLPFADNAFDVVWASEVIEHVADTARWLSEVRRVLAPRGRLLITTPSHGRLLLAIGGIERYSEPLGDHLHLYSKRSLRSLLDGFGFAEIEVRAVDGVGGLPIFKRSLFARASR